MDLPQFDVHAQTEECHWWFLGRRDILRALVESVLPPGRGHSIVDMGCGTGGNTAFFSKGYACTGVDPQREGIESARKRFPGVRFEVGYANDVRDILAQADLVMMIDVLEMIERDDQLIAQLLTPMKPGAYLLLTAAADPKLATRHDKAFAHVRRYTLRRMREAWKGQPVEEVYCSYFNTRLYPLVFIARMISRFLRFTWGPANTDMSVPPAPINALLRGIFAGERGRLLSKKQYRYGVSVVAMLRKTA